MKWWCKFTILLILPSILLACGGGASKHTPALKEETKAPVLSQKMLSSESSEAYFGALDAINEKKWQEAEEQLYSFVHIYHNSRFYLAGWVAYGEVLQQLGQWEESAQALRRVSSIVTDIRPDLRARAMTSLSFTYEMLGQNEKALTALLDALAVKDGLSRLKREVLIPARMSTIYARLSNQKQAERFARLANEGVQSIRMQGLAVNDAQKFAELLYRMGRNPVQSVENDKSTLDNIRGIKMSQEYLLQSLEMGLEPYIGLIEEEIIKSYQSLFRQFDRDKKTPAEVKELWAIAMLDAMDRFRYSRLPDPKGDVQKATQRIVNEFSKIENRLFAWVAQNSIDVRRTPEELSRSGLRREGRIIDPKELEKMRRKPYLLIDLDSELTKDPNL